MVSMKKIEVVDSSYVDDVCYEADKFRNYPRLRVKDGRDQSERYKQSRMLCHRL